MHACCLQCISGSESGDMRSGLGIGWLLMLTRMFQFAGPGIASLLPLPQAATFNQLSAGLKTESYKNLGSPRQDPIPIALSTKSKYLPPSSLTRLGTSSISSTNMHPRIITALALTFLTAQGLCVYITPHPPPQAHAGR